MVKETVQSIKAEKDKLKGKLQEIQAHLLDKLKAKHSDSHGSLGEATNVRTRWFGVTIEFRVIQGQHTQIISQNLLLNETDNSSSFCYSMI